jgi:hypothetical protein
MQKPFTVPVALAIVLAGCLTGTNETDPPTDPDPNAWVPFQFPAFTVPKPDFDFSTVIQPDHEAHNLPALHMAGEGLLLEGFAAVQDILPAGMRGSITQIDVLNGYALVSGMEQGPAFVILDITNPSQPRPLSYAPTVADGWTARFSKEDGDYVFYGCQIVSTAANPDPYLRGNCRDPNAGPPVNGDPGLPASAVNVYDVRDKSNPRFVDSIPANGSHNIQTVKINGVDYVTTATTEIIKFDREQGRLEHVIFLPGQHDSTVGRHPLTGDWLLFTGRSGSFVVYNINDPYEPEVVLEPGAFSSDGWHEQVLFPQLVDGRALLAVAGEAGVSAGGVGSKVTFVDITDPAKPVKLSEWRPPFAPVLPWAEYAFSVHEGAATPQGQFAIAWYHGGVWVVDVSTQERQKDPVIVAAYQPHEMMTAVPSTFVQTPVPYVPFVWSAAWDERGYLVIPDMHTGVYVLEPEWGLIPMLDGGA